MATKRYQDDKSYLLKGRDLNEIWRAIDTGKLLPGPGYTRDIIPGTGTRLKVRPAGNIASPLWDLEVVNPETAVVKISNPGLLKRSAALDNSDLVTITALTAEFTAAAGKLLFLEITPALVTTLKMDTTWGGWPMPIDTEETTPPGLWVMTKYYYPLYDFLASSTDPDAIKINDNLYAERRGFNSHLRIEATRQEDKDGHLVSAFEIFSAVGCRRS